MASNLGTFVFHKNITEPSEGNVLIIKKASILTFTIEGTATNIDVQFEAQSHEEGKFIKCFCYSLEGDPKVTTEAKSLNDVHWRIDLPSLYSFRVKVNSISGGNADIIGTLAG